MRERGREKENESEKKKERKKERESKREIEIYKKCQSATDIFSRRWNSSREYEIL